MFVASFPVLVSGDSGDYVDGAGDGLESSELFCVFAEGLQSD